MYTSGVASLSLSNWSDGHSREEANASRSTSFIFLIINCEKKRKQMCLKSQHYNCFL